MRRLIAPLAALLCIGAPAHGAGPAQSARVMPTVIYDAGGVPIETYLKNVVPQTQPRDPGPPAGAPAVPAQFPVVTTLAQPGPLGEPRRGKLAGGPGIPLCVVGDDPLSERWLEQNRAALEGMRASCLVVSVRDQAAFRRLQDKLGPIPYALGSFDALAKASDIRVWPVLVSPDGLVSQ